MDSVLSELRWHVQCSLVQKTPHDHYSSIVEFIGWPLGGGSDPAFFVIWSRLWQLRLTTRPRGPLGHCAHTSSCCSSFEIGLSWDSEQAGWVRLGLPPSRTMTGLIQHFRSAMWQAWQDEVATYLCKRKGVGVSLVLMLMAPTISLPLLT